MFMTAHERHDRHAQMLRDFTVALIQSDFRLVTVEDLVGLADRLALACLDKLDPPDLRDAIAALGREP